MAELFHPEFGKREPHEDAVLHPLFFRNGGVLNQATWGKLSSITRLRKAIAGVSEGTKLPQSKVISYFASILLGSGSPHYTPNAASVLVELHRLVPKTSWGPADATQFLKIADGLDNQRDRILRLPHPLPRSASAAELKDYEQRVEDTLIQHERWKAVAAELRKYASKINHTGQTVT